MLLIFIVLGVFAALRIVGALGVAALKDWRFDLRIALAVMFLVTASGHWGARRAELVAMVPPLFPNAALLVTLTGIAEIAGAIGLLWSRTARVAAACLAVLLLAMFPANVYAARQNLTLGGRPVTELPLRTAVQVGLVAATIAIAATRQSSSNSRNRTRTSLSTTSSSSAGSMIR